MKKALFLLSFLSLLTLALPSVFAAPEAVAAAENDIIRVESVADVDTHSCTFAFSEPMVAPEQVGKPAADGTLSVSPDRTVETMWLSSSTLQVKVVGRLEPLDILHVTLNHEQLRSLAGHAVTPETLVLPEHRYANLVNHSWNAEPGQPILFSASEPRYDALVEEAAQNAYYLVTERDGEGKGVRNSRVPASVRPATVADALRDWEAYEPATDFEVSEEDRLAFQQRPGNEVLPYIWCAEPYAGATVSRSVEFILPGLGDFDEESSTYKDEVCSYVRRGEFAYMLSNERTGEGEYRVKLAFTQPLPAEQVPAMIKSLPWRFLTCRRGETEAPLEQGEDGVWRGESEYSRVELTPLTEETMAGMTGVKVSDSEMVDGVSNLYFRAKVTGDRVRLSMNRSFTSVYGNSLTERELKFYGHQDRDYTVLAPRRPRIYTDLLNNTMNAAGAGVLRCRYNSLHDMHITIHRVEADSPQAAILLGRYLQHYSPAVEDYRHTWYGSETVGDGALPEDLWVLLPHQKKTISLPEEEGETEVNLKELFGAETQGMFFIDAGGATHPEWQEGAHVVNQGLVQLTNLGLMWKLSGHSLFACAYHLSDGKPVPAAELRLLDAEGERLATVPVKDGLAQLPMPENVAFLQLAEGGDCYTTTAAARDCDISAEYDLGYTPQERRVMNEMPQARIFLFSDRGLYRPGETAHIKGMLRFVTGNTVSNPGLESVELTLQGEEEQTVSAELSDDGSFSADIPLDDVSSSFVLKAVCTVKGDADKTSPDIAYLLSNKVPEPDDEDDYSLVSRLWDEVKENREGSLYLTVSDFRRNAFEVRTAMEMRPETHAVSVTTDAVNLTGAPVAEGNVICSLRTDTRYFCPAAYPGYVFGDCRKGSMREDYYDSYSDDESILSSRGVQYAESETDEQGHASATFVVPMKAYPAPVELIATSRVTDDNEQTIWKSTSFIYHPCSVYAGINCGESIREAGSPLHFKLAAVSKDGTAYSGAPLSATLTVTRKVAHNYRYGAHARTDVHSFEEILPVEKRAVILTGAEQEVDIATKEAGEYTVELEGKDPEGNAFRTAVTYFVWGGDVSPWTVESGTEMRVITSPVVYKPGDTAKVLVMTPVDGEVLITMERGGVLRHYRRSVTVSNPVVEIPVEEADAPEVYVSAFLVQTGEKNRAANGIPLQKLGRAKLRVLPVRQLLTVELEAPRETQRPGQEGTVGGVVRDADGKPVVNASVTLFAEDEGVLQVKGYTLPNPVYEFLAQRRHGVRTYSSLNQLLGEDLAKRDFGNKGVFIGGGDDDEGDDEDGALTGRVREDFAPCALWLADLRTDENGRFTATFRHPDTLTRYRLMAVCAAGEDKFGRAQAAYKVDTPVRVEPSAPLTATVGDELELPVTVSMNPEELPAAAQGTELTWKVTLSGTPNVALPQAEQSVTLNGAVPRTVMHPVTLTSAGDCKLTWRVQGTGAAAAVGDAAAFSFTVRPPMPFLREAVCSVIEPGKSAEPADWFRGQFAADTTAELTFSTSPLTGAADGVHYLITYPHGCVEQLSSGMLPWAFREELEQAVGLRYPEGKDAETVVPETTDLILDRLLENGFFSYWSDGDANRNFTPYVALVLSECDPSPEMSAELEETDKVLKQELQAVSDANLVGLYYLAKRGLADAALLKTVLAKRATFAKPNESELWLLAATAELLKEHDLAKELVAEARKVKGTGVFRYGLPSAMATESLWAVIAAPEDPATARQLRLYVESVAQNCPTTWECGWMCLIIHEYLKRAQLADRTATLNGQVLSMSNPLHLSVRAGDKIAYKAEGAPVYVSGTVEGYQAKPQPEKMVDQGFAVTRRYEKLNPDGTWTPTGTFRVGDVVRVTITAKHTDKQPAVYVALEDRLPSAFEAVNPDLTSQALPEDILTDEGNWLCSGFINNREYLKDCVRFYVTRWGEGELTARYIARVVKSGKVTAPAAKAELMYRPQVYGLAIPQHFTILPR